MAKKSTTPAVPRTRRATTKPAAAAGSGSGPDSKPGQAHKPSADEIAQAAYRRYLSRGGQDGSDFDDWIEAERELTTRRTR